MTVPDFFGYGDVRNVYVPQPTDYTVLGGLYVGPVFYEPYPLDPDVPIPDAFKHLGYISEDGLKITEDRSTKGVNAFGGEEVADVQENYSLQIQMKLIEFLNPEVQKLSHGKGNVTVTDAAAAKGRRMLVDQNSRVLDRVSLLFVTFGQSTGQVRKYAAHARVVKQGEQQFVHKDVTGADLTLKTFPYKGKNLRGLIDDGQVAQ